MISGNHPHFILVMWTLGMCVSGRLILVMSCFWCQYYHPLLNAFRKKLSFLLVIHHRKVIFDLFLSSFILYMKPDENLLEVNTSLRSRCNFPAAILHDLTWKWTIPLYRRHITDTWEGTLSSFIWASTKAVRIILLQEVVYNRYLQQHNQKPYLSTEFFFPTSGFDAGMHVW